MTCFNAQNAFRQLNNYSYNIVFLGDSNTKRTSYPTLPSFELSYPNLILEHYRRNNKLDVMAINEGVSGYTVENLTTNIATKLYANASSLYDQTRSFLKARVQASAGDEFKIYHYTQAAKTTDGLGFASDIASVHETYLQLKITEL